MTRDEAIKAFEEIKLNAQTHLGKKYAAGCEGYYQDKIDLADAALSALRPVSREQVERMRGEWRECFEDWRKQIAGDQCSKCGFQHYGTSINHYHFCPACGAPMTDEAVDIVMGRLEQIKCKN